MFKVVTLRTFDAFGCEKWEEFDEEWKAIKTEEAFLWKRKWKCIKFLFTCLDWQILLRHRPIYKYNYFI